MKFNLSKFNVLTFILVAQLHLVAFSQSDVIDNKTIINLTKKKVQESIIVSKIRSATCLFDVSTDGLINLKDNGVSDGVIQEMISKSKSSSKKTGKKDIDDILTKFEESGIYFKDEDTGDMIKLDATPTTGQRSNTPVTAYGSKKSKLQIAGIRANYVVKPGVEFYLFFESSNTSLNSSQNKEDQTNPYNIFLTKNPEAVSPNDFLVIKCSIRGKSREFQAGSVSVFGEKGGIDGRQVVDFQYKKIAKNLFKLTFPDGVEAGQYIFYYAGNSRDTQNPYAAMYNKEVVKVYDFEVR
jgi:hypothetical protein